MRRTNFFMRILIVLPVILFVALLVWVAADGRPEGVKGGRAGALSSAQSRSGDSEDQGSEIQLGGDEGKSQKTMAEQETDSLKSHGEGDLEKGSMDGTGAASAQTGGDHEKEGEASGEGGSYGTQEKEAGGQEGVEPTEKSNYVPGIKPSQKPSQSQKTEPEPKGTAIHLLLGGGVYLSNSVLSAYDKGGGISGVVDGAYRAEIKKSDIFMVNQGFPFSDRGLQSPNKQASYRVSPDRINVLRDLGIGIVSIANDHVLDYGADALVDTCKFLDHGGILRVGAGTDIGQAKKLATIGVNGRSIGFIGASNIYPDSDWVAGADKPGILSGFAPSILIDEIKRAGDFCDYLVVYLYWGMENDEKPQEPQRMLAKQLIDAGADLVVGCHSDAPQGIEFYKGKPIVYSLGNFLADNGIPKMTLLKADVYLDDDMVRLELLPGYSASGFTRELSDPTQLHDFYQHIQDISFGVTVDDHGRIRLR